MNFVSLNGPSFERANQSKEEIKDTIMAKLSKHIAPNFTAVERVAPDYRRFVP
jgi:NADPH-dependent 7-cyano-7-deazaguanine reductase QueF